ncbi:DUF1236 domain-containing protein [Rhizobium terrae]|uniref:DUF1236 domain-containing protein n=1 Tax=Rhizobium terrae TaxID=2171756 RepID=UPI000E3C2EBE|nr:DUF1236 domain-containing protein [Rhizobium terrae]
MRKTLLAASAALMALSGAAYAQTVITQDPVVTNSTVVLPGEVRTYVMEQSVPSVSYEGPVVVGTTLPEAVEIHTIQDQPSYAYTIVNDQRVIVNPQTRAVIQVLE